MPSAFWEHERDIHAVLSKFVCPNTRFQSVTVFNVLQSLFQTAELHTMRSSKCKGDLWEVSCLLYLRVNGWTVWSIEQLPADLRLKLRLPTRDMGIDLIAT